MSIERRYALIGHTHDAQQIEFATPEETQEGVVSKEAVDPAGGAYAYDRLRRVGRHEAGKATVGVELTAEAGVVTIDASLSNVFRYTATENFTLANPINGLNGHVIKIRIKQDATGGRTVTFGDKWRWISGSEPTLSTAANAVDVIYVGYDYEDDVWEASFLPDFTGTGTGWGVLPAGPPGTPGAEGPAGPTGPTGPAGTPAGGLTGEVLTKLSDADYDADWQAISSMSLDSLTDTNVGSAVDLDALVFDSATSKWVPVAFSLASLQDVDLTGLADGDAIVWDSATSKFIPGVAGDVSTDAIWDAKGDLAAGTGANTAARLPVGTDGQVLAADSAEATGLKWIDAPSGGGTTVGVGVGIISAEKTTDETRASTTTLTDDSELFVDVPSEGTYSFAVDVFCEVPSSPDIKMDMAYSGTASRVKWHFLYFGAAVEAGTTSQFSAWYDSFSPASPPGFLVSSLTQGVVRISGTFTATTAGRLSLRWAQYTSNATASTVKKCSYLSLTPLYGAEIRKYATSDVTRASTTTLADDPDLVATLSANTKYKVLIDAWFEVPATPDMKYDLNFTGTTTSMLHSHIQWNGAAANLATGITSGAVGCLLSSAFNVVHTLNFTATGAIRVSIEVNVEVGSTGGVFSLRWAQNVSNATATTRKRGSTLIATPF